MAHGFKQVWVRRRHTTEGVAGTNFRNGAFVAIHAPIMAHLEKKRPIPKPIATLDAFGATDAKFLVDRVFVIRILHETSFDSCGWAQAVFSARIEIVWFRFEIPRAQLAIAANGVGMHTFHGGLLQHAMGRAVSAANTFLRIDLPNRPLD